LGVVGAALVVQVAHRRLDVSVAHPCLDLHNAGYVDRQRAEGAARRSSKPDRGSLAGRLAIS